MAYTSDAKQPDQIDFMKAHIAQLEAKLARAMEALEDLYMNTSTSMPAAYNDEASWYRSQLHSVIGRAARAAKELKALEGGS